MVYCGKASNGCQNCRTRRIKCDRLAPECSQCKRAKKKCPGYRDQLSLMFRDESSKVMEKAQAQWGSRSSEEVADYKQIPPGSAVSLPPSYPWAAVSTSSSSPQPSTPDATTPLALVSRSESWLRDSSDPAWIKVPRPIDPTLAEQGIQFFIDRYIIGHPDEPNTPERLSDKAWVFQPTMQNVMAAVGLAGLSNLNGREDMRYLAREKYGLVLQDMQKSLQRVNVPDMDILLRSVVSLALFETVRAAQESIEGARKHIVGAAALMKSLPLRQTPVGGVRGLIQLCISMFIPYYVACIPMPADLLEGTPTTDLGSDAAQAGPSLALLHLAAQFVNLSILTRTSNLVDGREETARVIKQALYLDSRLDEWERGTRGGPYAFEVHEGKFDPDTCFRGQYHIYTDMFIARIWGCLRWARILVSELILDLAGRFPVSMGPSVTGPGPQTAWLATIGRLAEDIIVSTPTHWRHPRLTPAQRDVVSSLGNAGAGAAGVPLHAYHLRVAACAPGVSTEHWAFCLGTLRCIWADMGMMHARSLADVLVEHREKQQQQQQQTHNQKQKQRQQSRGGMIPVRFIKTEEFITSP